MREQLLIFYTPGQNAIEAQLLDSEGQAAASTWRGDLADLAPLAEGRRLQVIVPSEAVVMHRAELPVAHRSKARSAVPYLLEDQLLDDVENLHFAIDGQGALLDVAAVAHQQMQQWTQAFRQYDIQPQVMVPDVLAIPLHENSWSIWLEDERILVRTASHQGWACQWPYLETLLRQALAQSEDKPLQWQIYDHRSAAPASLDEILKPLAETMAIIHHDKVDKPHLLMAVNLLQEKPLNLLQGRYRYKQQLARLLRPWRYSLYGVATLLTLAVLASLVQYLDLVLEKSRVEAQIESTVQQYFPSIKSINFYQLEGRIKREASQLQKEGLKEGYFYMLQAVGRIVQSYPEMQLQQLNYQNNQLELHIATEQPARIDELLGRLRSSTGLKADAQVRDKLAVIKVRG